MWKNSDWFKLTFFAFCVAVFLFLLQLMFAPYRRGSEIGRYQRLHSATKDMIYYIDTVTGAVYDIDGGLVSRPKGE